MQRQTACGAVVFGWSRDVQAEAWSVRGWAECRLLSRGHHWLVTAGPGRSNLQNSRAPLNASAPCLTCQVGRNNANHKYHRRRSPNSNAWSAGPFFRRLRKGREFQAIGSAQPDLRETLRRQIRAYLTFSFVASCLTSSDNLMRWPIYSPRHLFLQRQIWPTWGCL